MMLAAKHCKGRSSGHPRAGDMRGMKDCMALYRKMGGVNV